MQENLRQDVGVEKPRKKEVFYVGKPGSIDSRELRERQKQRRRAETAAFAKMLGKRPDSRRERVRWQRELDHKKDHGTYFGKDTHSHDFENDDTLGDKVKLRDEAEKAHARGAIVDAFEDHFNPPYDPDTDPDNRDEQEWAKFLKAELAGKPLHQPSIYEQDAFTADYDEAYNALNQPPRQSNSNHPDITFDFEDIEEDALNTPTRIG